MKKKMFAIGMAGLTVASMGAVAAMPNFLQDNVNIQSSLKSADYNNFLVELEQIDPVMAEHMTEFRFDKMIEQNARWIAVENNDYEAWVESFPENSRIEPTREMFDEMVARQQNHEVIELALEDGNYEAWKAAVQENSYGKGMNEIITEEDFNVLREIHQLREDGDYTTARGLALELGMGSGMYGEGRGVGRMNSEANGLRDGSGSHREGQGMGKMNSEGQALRDGSGQGGMKGQGIHRQ